MKNLKMKAAAACCALALLAPITAAAMVCFVRTTVVYNGDHTKVVVSVSVMCFE